MELVLKNSKYFIVAVFVFTIDTEIPYLHWPIFVLNHLFADMLAKATCKENEIFMRNFFGACEWAMNIKYMYFFAGDW